ncbi:unnamed protein product [Soboliphyme baturini]|uniref:Ion_trans domain-containing protein n=1 Tax=Soboliphyme baturini TaxID=241478 RepID=A0A183IQ40_9BILA|nr:unnamed protein product [Soboliphyme baturini]
MDKTVTKAAAISSAMLTRKQSFKGRESFGIDYFTEKEKESTDIRWYNRQIPLHVISLFCFLSLMSISLNTPVTFRDYKFLRFVTYGVDVVATLIFTLEAAVKMQHRGILRRSTEMHIKDSRSYLHDRWCQFDFIMLISHWISIATQAVDLVPFIIHGPSYEYDDENYPSIKWLGILRSPRPLIMVRLIRSLLKIQLPKNRINQIFKYYLYRFAYLTFRVNVFRRSSQQVYNVTIFFLFFMSLYGILGVQFFGRMDYHCVRNGTDPNAQPLTRHPVLGILPHTNVFIAVITETFAEIRVQFSQMWGNREVLTEAEITQVLEKGADGWKFIAMNASKTKGWAPKICQNFYSSNIFQIIIMVLVLSNALINASFIHRHDGSDVKRSEIYYYIECSFTLAFDLECLFKIWCLGWIGYIRRGLHKFEFILCLGSTLSIIKPLHDMKVFTYFQIFGPGKKLGGLVLFTMALLLITSSISLQLFCFVHNLDKFRTLPDAIMAMFQIMTQEEWTEVVVETMRAVGEALAPLVAIYFVTYHLLVTLIVLSLFVAVILDNLEMDEELKKIKQMKATEHTTSSRTKLPLRLRVFTRFPNCPQTVEIKRLPGEFPLPKIRDSFTKHYATDEQEEKEEEDKSKRKLKCCIEDQKLTEKSKVETNWTLVVNERSQLRTEVSRSLHLADKARVMLTDSLGIIPLTNRMGTQKSFGSEKRRQKSLPQQNLVETFRMKQMYNHLKENGDLMVSANMSEKKDKTHSEIDIKAIQQRKRQAEMTRSRLEEEMKENHPLFDKPLFMLDRENRIRKFCQYIAYANNLLGLMTYLDWTVFFVTCVSCISMLFEKPWPLEGTSLLMNNGYLQIAEYWFVITMTFELVVKVLANGLFFTPKALIHDFGGVLSVFIYTTSVIFLVWMPKHVAPNSVAQLFMIFRAVRPLRLYTLVPHIRRVVVELFRGFREILLVTVLLIVLMFIFASYGVQIAGGKLATCNDFTIKNRDECTGQANPRNFNFDHIGNAMLALFEILSFKGWTVVRDVILERLGAVSSCTDRYEIFEMIFREACFVQSNNEVM